MSTHPSINYSSHYLSGQQWQSKWNLFTKSSEVHGVGTKRPTWSSTLMIPFLLFLFPLPGSHMSQTTSHNVHMWDRGHFPFMEARYLMVVITGIPNVISGTGIVWFLFSESGAWANCTYPTYPCFSLISIFLFNKKQNLKKEVKIEYSAEKRHQSTVSQDVRIYSWMSVTTVLSQPKIGTGGSSFINLMPPECQVSPRLFAGTFHVLCPVNKRLSTQGDPHRLSSNSSTNLDPKWLISGAPSQA